MRPMFEGFQADSPSSWLGAGLDTLDLPGALVRGLLAGRPGERVSGDELLRGWGYDDPGAFASTATSMATDPLSYLALLGPAARLLRGAGAVGEGLGAAKAATAATPFLKSAAFGFGAPLAGAAVMDANKPYGNATADMLATGLMAAPLAVHGPGMVMNAGRRLAGGLRNLAGFGGAAEGAEAANAAGAANAARPMPGVPGPAPVNMGRRNFLKQVGGGLAAAAMPGNLMEGFGAARDPVLNLPPEHLFTQLDDLANKGGMRWLSPEWQNGLYDELPQHAPLDAAEAYLNRQWDQHERLAEQFAKAIESGDAAKARQLMEAANGIKGNMLAADPHFSRHLDDAVRIDQQNWAQENQGRGVRAGAGGPLVPYQPQSPIDPSRYLPPAGPSPALPLDPRQVPFMPPLVPGHGAGTSPESLAQALMQKHPRDMTAREYGDAVRDIMAKTDAAEKHDAYDPSLRQFQHDPNDWKTF